MSYYTYRQFAFDVPTRTVHYRRDEKGWHERDDYQVAEDEVQTAAEELGVTAEEAFVYRWVLWWLGSGDVRNSVSARVRRGLAAAKERLFDLDPEDNHECFDFMSSRYEAAPHAVRGAVEAFLDAHGRRERRDEHVVLIFDGWVVYKARSRGGRAYTSNSLSAAQRYPNAFEANAAINNDKNRGRSGRRVAVPVSELAQNPSRVELERFFAD